MRTMSQVAAVIVLVVSMAGCGGGPTVGVGESQGVTSPLKCEHPADDPSGMLILMAQSVPEASAVPCLRRVPENWMLARFEVENGRSTLGFEYHFDDTEGATMVMAAQCDPRGATEVSSEQSGMRRYDRAVTRPGRYADERYYVYPGACTSLRFDLSGTGILPGLRGAELAAELAFISRDKLAEEISEISHGRLRLDPDPAR
jgi:hypothetical protein